MVSASVDNTTSDENARISSSKRAGIIAAVVGLVVVAFFLFIGRGIAEDAGRPLTTLSPKGGPAEEIHSLVKPVFIVAGLVFVLVQSALLFTLFRYRRHKDDADGVDEPIQRHGNNPLEWAWTIGPALLLAFLAIPNVQTIWALENDAKNADMEVEVRGQQWWWEFRYDTNNDGKPEVITAQQLVIPVGETVRVKIRSNDVIHSFWIPALNGKKDAVPGRTHRLAIQAEKPGIYEGQCTEFCGLSHGYMRMQVKALSEADYATWMANQTSAPEEPVNGTEAALGKEIYFQKCASCHQINGYDSAGGATGEDLPDPDYRGRDHPLTAGNAPNLSHMMSRQRFAGNMFDLYEPDGQPQSAIPAGTPNESKLGEWLRNPQLRKPMAADLNRGMPNLKLSEEEIRVLVAYLTQLK